MKKTTSKKVKAAAVKKKVKQVKQLPAKLRDNLLSNHSSLIINPS
jgi:hypothetical protein